MEQMFLAELLLIDYTFFQKQIFEMLALVCHMNEKKVSLMIGGKWGVGIGIFWAYVGDWVFGFDDKFVWSLAFDVLVDFHRRR